MKIYRELIKTYNKKRFARVKRFISKKEYFINRGYIISVNKKFTFLKETEDFLLCGTVIIPTKHIRSIRYNKNDRFYDSIMKFEGQKKSLDDVPNYSFKNWAGLFKFLKDQDKYVIIELERQIDKVFIIGELVKVKSKSVLIRYFNATGEWDENLTKVEYEKITKVTFNDRYIKVFRKYLVSK